MGNRQGQTCEVSQPSDIVLLTEDCMKVPFGRTGLTLRRWLWSNDEANNPHFLESSHNFVQYILPTNEPSQYLPDSPIVSQDDILRCQSSMVMMDSIVKSAILMLSFWGIRLVHFQVPIPPSDAWSVYKPLGQYALSLALSEHATRAQNNVLLHPHNIPRMTRLVKCLRLFGLIAFATEALLLLNEVLKMIDDAKEDQLLRESVFIIESDKTSLQSTVFSNQYLAQEFLQLENLHGENDMSTFNAEKTYFDLVVDARHFDLLQYAHHVQKMWTQ